MRAALIAIAASGIAGCSSESTRFGEAFSNPFASRPQPNNAETTGSIAPRPAPAPVSRVESRPLPQVQAQAPLPPPPAPPQTRPAEITGSVTTSPQGPTVITQNSNWDWNGGTAVIVGQGENLDVIAHRYGVPATAIAQANGFATHTPIYPGQRLVIPRYNYSAAPAPVPAPVAAAPQMRPAPAPAPVPHRVAAAPAPAPAATPAQGFAIHIVNPGDTLHSIARRYKVGVKQLAAANRLQTTARLAVGDRIAVPGGRVAPAAQPVIAAPQIAPPPPQRYVAAQAPTNTARIATPVEEKETTPPPPAVAAEPMGTTTAGLRWPVKGRVIANFGPGTAGAQNDGINLAVPEGTPVKAADDGTVAYAGNELKGYGNLVLVRHASGYVTAYAHASELMVKRGDSVKRGQVIAKSGQTGNVTSPQLHFEVRKGATPVDPVPLLSGANG